MFELPRRAFLRQLTALPLIGGGVTLIGQPSAVAEPVTPRLLKTYERWLDLERYRVHEVLSPRPPGRPEMFTFPFYARSWGVGGPAFNFHCNGDGTAKGECPSTRAALVLSAVGCDWREG